MEARQFDERLPEFEEKDVRVIGVSRDEPDALQRFCVKYDLGFTFLSDTDHSVHEAYGAWGERLLRGVGAIRSTVLVGADGRVERAWYGVSANGHAEEVLAAV